jgi:hypothetical protein
VTEDVCLCLWMSVTLSDKGCTIEGTHCDRVFLIALLFEKESSISTCIKVCDFLLSSL